MNRGLLGWPRGAAFPKGLLGFPLGRSGYGKTELQTFFQAAGQSFFEVITAAGGANTKGTWVELCSACPYDAAGFILSNSNHANVTNYLLDIGIGPTSTSVVTILENVGLTGVSSAGGANSVAKEAFFPVPIPAGAKVWARCQSATGGSNFRSLFTPIRVGGFYALLREYLSEGIAVTYGANTADSGGVEIDPGAGAANTYGSFIDIATTSRDHKALMVCNQSGAIAVGTNAKQNLALGSQREILLPDYITNTTPQGTSAPGWHPVIYADIPAGTLLSARGMSSVTTGNRLVDIIVIGFS